MRLKMVLYIITIVCCWGKTFSNPQELFNEFKTNILPIFGMKDRPRLSGTRPYIPDDLKKIYEAHNNLEYETASLPLPGLHTRSANTVRSFVHVESPIDEKFSTPNKFRLKFDISSIPKHEKLKAAEIKLTRESLGSSTSPHYRLLVHDIIRRGIKGVSPPIMRIIDSKLIDTRGNSSVSIDVFPAVERWLADPKSNHGVLVVLVPPSKHTPSERHIRLRRNADVDWWHKQPVLYTYTDDGKNRQRTKRELANLRPKRGFPRKRTPLRKGEKDPCRRRPMYVDFKDVGWSDWIVAPPGYDAYFCAGQCEYPMPEHLNTTNHAIVQSLVNSAKPAEVPKPCCIPTSLSSISMLYVASNERVILKNYKDMVVVGCGCR